MEQGKIINQKKSIGLDDGPSLEALRKALKTNDTHQEELDDLSLDKTGEMINAHLGQPGSDINNINLNDQCAFWAAGSDINNINLNDLRKNLLKGR